MTFLKQSYAAPNLGVPWKETSLMEERLEFVTRLRNKERLSDLCLEFLHLVTRPTRLAHARDIPATVSCKPTGGDLVGSTAWPTPTY